MSNAPPDDTWQGMHAEIRECFVPLLGQFFHIKAVWQQLVTLTGDNRNLELLNKSAPGFFWVVSFTLWDYVVLGICRFADPAEQGADRQNMTLHRLINLVDDAGLKHELKHLLKSCDDDLAAMRTHRNKRIAHNDFPTMSPTLMHLNPLPKIELAPVEQTMETYHKMLSLVERHYTGIPSLAYVIEKGAGTLMVLLGDALDAGFFEPGFDGFIKDEAKPAQSDGRIVVPETLPTAFDGDPKL